MPSSLSCPSCAAVILPQETRGLCPQCRTPLPGFAAAVDETRLADDDLERTGYEAPSSARPVSDSASGHQGGSKYSVRPGSEDPGRTPPQSASAPTSGWLSTSGAIDHGRFAPGTLLGGRYRIVGRLGRGGMGEVFRADDLKLGQAVALKFLPADVDRDPARLTQLHTEVRMARQVSHPNVCRVYDIDEIDGSTFLSMEYVDGEDLASLLRRIGRFPEDRALEIARQICAGLAAAHERGVIHRDLKPANVMIDGTGKVRITDFGLAGASGEAIRAGTPAYMAPEQLAGAEVTARSDIYSLGLVLYEIVTGQRALDGKNLAELIHKREQSGIVPPTLLVKTLDPDIESAIMRCLKPEPEARPRSALAVAAALPGGDPLAAALAAGETPSPEMVAAAGDTAAVHPATGLALVAAILIGLVAYMAIGDRRLLYNAVPMHRSLDSLEDRARELAASFGYPERPADSARGLRINGDYLRYLGNADHSPARWAPLATTDAPVMLFWYRSSPEPLLPLAPELGPGLTDPPVTVPGMMTVTLDDRGRLVLLQVVPPRRSDPAAKAPPTGAAWPALFAAAGLTMGDFHGVEAEWIPPAYADERAAWEGPLRGDAKVPVRVEAAALQGKPVSFRLVGPWVPPDTPAGQPAGGGPSIGRGAINALLLVLLLATVALARSHLRTGRGDRRGAARIALFTLGTWMLGWAIGARHYAAFQDEFNHLFSFLAIVVFNTGIVWLLYIALEPYVRRFVPAILVSWSRLMAGQFRDPQVGRDLLIGVAVGVGVALMGAALPLLAPLIGDPPAMLRSTNTQFLLGSRAALGTLLRMVPNAIINAMFVSIVFVMGRAALRSVWVGAVCAGVVLAIFILGESSGDRLWVTLVFTAAFVIPIVATLIRFGILPVATVFLVNQTLNNSPLTLDWSQPHAAGALWTIAVVVGLTLYGFYASRAGQPLLGHLLDAD